MLLFVGMNSAVCGIKKEMDIVSISFVCRGDRTRTCDSLVPNQERYQLRYTSLPTRFPDLRLQRYTFFLKQPNVKLANFLF